MEATTSDKYFEELNFVVAFLRDQGFSTAEEVLLKEIESRFPSTHSGNSATSLVSQHESSAPSASGPEAEESSAALRDLLPGVMGEVSEPDSIAKVDHDEPAAHAPAPPATGASSHAGPKPVPPLAAAAAVAPAGTSVPRPSFRRASAASSSAAAKRRLHQLHMTWDCIMDEYENLDDVGYVRRDVSGQQRFVENELDAGSEEGSDKYFMHPPGTAAGAYGHAAARGSAGGAVAGGGGAADDDDDGDAEASSHSETSSLADMPLGGSSMAPPIGDGGISPAAAAAAQRASAAGSGATTGGATTPVTGVSTPHSQGRSGGSGSSLNDAPSGSIGSGLVDLSDGSGLLSNRFPHATVQDEIWALGPLDIKFVEPVVTPSKQPRGSAGGESSKPAVLSRVESLSSSFKDYEEDACPTERNLSDNDDDPCPAASASLKPFFSLAPTSGGVAGGGSDGDDGGAGNAHDVDFSLPSGAEAVGLDDIEAARQSAEGGHWPFSRSIDSSVAAAAGSTVSAMQDSIAMDSAPVSGGGASAAGLQAGRALGLQQSSFGSSSRARPGPSTLSAVAGPATATGDAEGSAEPAATDMAEGNGGSMGEAVSDDALVADADEFCEVKAKPLPVLAELDTSNKDSGAGGTGGGGGGGFSFPVTPPSTENANVMKPFTSWPSVRSSTSDMPGLEYDELAAEYADEEYSRNKMFSRSASESLRQSPLSEDFTLQPSPSADLTLVTASPLLPNPFLVSPASPSTSAAAAVAGASVPPALQPVAEALTMESSLAVQLVSSPSAMSPSASGGLPANLGAEAAAAPLLNLTAFAPSPPSALAAPLQVEVEVSQASHTAQAGSPEPSSVRRPGALLESPNASGGAEPDSSSAPATPTGRPSGDGLRERSSRKASPADVVAHMINLSLEDFQDGQSDQFHSMMASEDGDQRDVTIDDDLDDESLDTDDEEEEDEHFEGSGSGSQDEEEEEEDEEEEEGSGLIHPHGASDPGTSVTAEPSAASASVMPRYTVDDQGVLIYEFDREYIERKYEIFDLRIIHRRQRTGFEESKDFPIRMNDLIAGRYQVMDFLGSAAFSRAVQALDIKTGTLVCLKIIKNNKDYFDQSLDEIKLLKFINDMDPQDEFGLVRLYDFFYYKEHLFLVCELLRANLYEFQKYNKESGDDPYFTNARIRRIGTQVLRSLAYLHSLGLIHSDLKPENVLIKSYSRCEVKVIDLGSSCFVTDQLSSYVQSRSYRAPEVILGLPYDQKIDIWSLGCILAELASGYVLFQNDSLATMLARLEGILGPVPRWMVAKGRYSCRFYTRAGAIYERSAVTDRYELLLPKRTSLRHRVTEADEGLLDFIAFLLTMDPHQRPTATEALSHPWLLRDD